MRSAKRAWQQFGFIQLDTMRKLAWRGIQKIMREQKKVL